MPSLYDPAAAISRGAGRETVSPAGVGAVPGRVGRAPSHFSGNLLVCGSEERMTRFRYLLTAALLSLPALTLTAQTDPREQSFQFFVDGTLTAGAIGYQIEFNKSPVSRTDSRRLDTAYSPDQRRFVISVTQKGLNRLQDWLNSATATGAPTSKNVAIVARTVDGTILARWEMTGVTPATVSSAGAGTLTEVDATIEFQFDTLTLTQAKAD